MFYVANYSEHTIIINKSRFIGQVYPVNSIDDVENILQKVRKKFYDANHNCFAYIIGDNQEIQKCSDDGEPQKTAGFPILEVIKKQGFTNILVIVTRYFGGILLGAGGLVRAYTDSTVKALEQVNKLIKVNFLETTLAVDYSVYNQILKLPYLKIKNANFLTDVTITVLVSYDNKEKLLKDLQNLLRVNNLELSFNSITEFTKL